jgi:cyclophilin family peptidyl-prolyl cis-trans isomerase
MNVLTALVLAAAVAGSSPPRVGEERVLLRTNRGDMVLALYPDVAPRHTAQILKLVRLGVYDSTWIYRVQPGFMAQLGNAQNRRRPLSAEQRAAIEKLPPEFSAVPHTAGVLSMAREPADPGSAETSFSFILSAAPHLDGKYTVFGEVEWGLPLLTMIAEEPRDERNTPRDPLVIEQALVQTPEEIGRLRLAGQLRLPVPLPPSSREASPQRLPPLGTVGVALMLGCGLLAFVFRERWPRGRLGALNLLVVLIGASLLIAGHLERPRQAAVVAAALALAIVALLKLRMRSSQPSSAARP